MTESFRECDRYRSRSENRRKMSAGLLRSSDNLSSDNGSVLLLPCKFHAIFRNDSRLPRRFLALPPGVKALRLPFKFREIEKLRWRITNCEGIVLPGKSERDASLMQLMNRLRQVSPIRSCIPPDGSDVSAPINGLLSRSRARLFTADYRH